MRKKTVVINKDYYELTAVDGEVSGAIAIDLIQEATPIIVAFFDGNAQLLVHEMRNSINSQKLMRIFKELININQLKKNNEIVRDWNEEFSCKPMTLFQLGIEALRFNCEDFFIFMSGFVKEKSNGQDWKEVMQNLKSEGMELPPMFSLLFPNGEKTTENQEQSTSKEMI